MPDARTVPSAVRHLAEPVTEPGPKRRGSPSERSVMSSQPGRLCGERPQARHDPSCSLTRAVASRTRSPDGTATPDGRRGHSLEAAQNDSLLPTEG